MINQNIEFIRSYFLSFDEEEQENIFSSLSDEQKDLIVEAGVVFLSNGGVETISENSYLIEHKRELKDIQLEYFIGLADILAAGGTNEVIEKLKKSKNLLFEEVLAEFKDNALFENDLLAGIRSVERKELKQDLSLLDKEEDELGIPDKEIKHAISQIERKTLKGKLQEIEDSYSENHYQHSDAFSGTVGNASYSNTKVEISRNRLWTYAVAASIILLVSSLGIYFFSRNDSKDLDSMSNKSRLDKRNNLVYNDLFVESERIYLKVLSDQSVENVNEVVFEVIFKFYDTLNAPVSRQIDSFADNLNDIQNRKIKAVSDLLNTYMFNGELLSINLSVSEKPKEVKIVSISDGSDKGVYLILGSKVFKISVNIVPSKLLEVNSKIVKDKIDYILKSNNSAP